MRFLLDTNVVSEWVNPQPNPRVVRWLDDVDEDMVYLSVTTFAEIRRGIELMAKRRRRDRMSDWLVEDLPFRFDGRILGIEHAVGHRTFLNMPPAPWHLRLPKSATGCELIPDRLLQQSMVA